MSVVKKTLTSLVAIMSMSLGALAVAQPAQAGALGCAVTVNVDASEAQIDNCAGNGRGGWYWLYNSGANRVFKAQLYVWTDYDAPPPDNSTGQWAVTVDANESQSGQFGDPGAKIRWIQICEWWWNGYFPPLPAYTCSSYFPV
ncbi:hypothetical protein ABZ646_20930 [Streptomyces sp. NPDC007162]|uniref:hypothetical protein n=1 Tax=Streptomyces sp. NPDC007162 TaxID=3156917 RepID=UPI0033EA3062